MSTRRTSRERPPSNPAAIQLIEDTSGQSRINPRNSEGDEATAAVAANETPRRILNQQASILKPTTPLRRASSAGPTSTYRSGRRTPAGRARTPGFGNRLNESARRAVTVTPHGRAARRELELRRGLTPGKDRRRSGLQQRETPRDTLRQLSRILAPKTLPTVPTPQEQNDDPKRIAEEDDDEDGTALPRPRFSLPGFDEDEDDEDDSLLLPPHSAGLEDENFTVQSIEMARRAVSELPPGRLSRGSFGSTRMSDVFADLNDTGVGGDVYDSSYLAERTFGDLDFAAGEDALEIENTDTIRNWEGGQPALASGRESDINLEMLPGDDTETTFVLNVPPQDASEEPQFEHTMEDDPELPEEPLDESLAGENLEGEVELDQMNGVDIDDQGESSLQIPADDHSMIITTIQGTESVGLQAKVARKKKVKVSKYGMQYPSLPAGVVKKLATTFARTSGNSKAKISKETLDAIMQASDWFFEQVSDDLGAFAAHAGRKTIDESDVVTLMARQRQINATTTPFSLAQRYLPRELLQELRMITPPKLKKGRQLGRVEEEE
ncbi:hypothetical protein BUE80_DR011526 [Diplocarpon rosae]|nr:hypothetical protein BUE80_DR011526 [Diplocarpon rosae]